MYLDEAEDHGGDDVVIGVVVEDEELEDVDAEADDPDGQEHLHVVLQEHEVKGDLLPVVRPHFLDGSVPWLRHLEGPEVVQVEHLLLHERVLRHVVHVRVQLQRCRFAFVHVVLPLNVVLQLRVLDLVEYVLQVNLLLVKVLEPFLP